MARRVKKVGQHALYGNVFPLLLVVGLLSLYLFLYMYLHVFFFLSLSLRARMCNCACRQGTGVWIHTEEA